MKRKLAYISNIPAPYTVKLITALQEYFDTEAFFYEKASGQRAAFWDTDLPPYCHLAPSLSFKKNGRYWTKAHLAWLQQFDPDIVLLSGFSIPANYLAYRLAKKNGKKVIVLTELSRSAAGVPRKKAAIWQLLTRLYKDVDAVFAVTPEAVTQFRDVFGFGEKVKAARYATDLDDYLPHPLRETKPDLSILFANRLTGNYNPLAALRIFRQVQLRFPEVKLLMNGEGECREQCEAFIATHQLQRVSFLDHLRHWQDLNEVYESSDILLLPAIYSAGNFTIYESMASGMGLVISENVLGNGPMIINGVNGFRLPLDEAAMANAVMHYLSAPGLLASHGDSNKQKVKTLGATGTAYFYYQLIQSIL